MCCRLNCLAALCLYRLIIAHSDHSRGVRGEAALLERQGGANETVKEWVRPKRTTGEFRVELARHKPWVIGEFDDLHETPVW
jgi:hypothetical protein